MRADVKAGDAAAARSPTRQGAPAPELAAAIERLARDVDDPVARLRLLRQSLERYEAVEEVVRTLPSPVARRWAYRVVRLEGLRALALGRRAALASGRYQAAWAGAALLLLAGAGAGAWALMRSPAAAPSVAARVQLRPPVAPPPPSAQPAAADRSPATAVPPAPQDVWLVEQGRDHELYSNGLRIETAFATDAPARRFRAFDLDGRLLEAIEGRPVGLLFHTSESDVWPMQASFNENLRDSSHRLLRYLQRERVYNYLIDRFGRVYRVVKDEGRANHAGHSIWAAGGRVYLNLNNAFLGVSFESQWGGGRALPITEAQFQAGRLLTAWLRQHWDIAPDMCVTHGLTSVNPRKHLIGHHVDWARGFPFAAFGLPDHYARPTPSVALFGFGYDEELLRKMDEPWEGVRAAERLLAEEAARRGLALEALLRERRALYDRWTLEQGRGLAAAPGGARRATGPGPTPATEWPGAGTIDFGASGG
jgi:hypothetical protein